MKRLAWLLVLATPLTAQVSYKRITRAESEPGNWLTYSGNYQGHRHSLLTQIIHHANIK